MISILMIILLFVLVRLITSNPQMVYIHQPTQMVKQFYIIRIYQYKPPPFEIKINDFHVYDDNLRSIRLSSKSSKYNQLLNHRYYEEKTDKQINIELLIPVVDIKKITISSQGEYNKYTYIDLITFTKRTTFCLGNYRIDSGKINITF